MTNKLQQISKYALPVFFAGLMSGCATVWDLENVQKQVDQAKASANGANGTAQEAKSLAGEARTTANAAMAASTAAGQSSTDANGFAAAAMKSSEAAANAAMQAQKMVGEATIAFPMMQYDPASRRFVMRWMIWPGVNQQAAATTDAPAATNGASQ